MLPDPSGALWVVSENALIWWNGNTSATMTGLPCNELYAVVKDEAGALWIYARCGLLSIAASELTRWHQNPSVQVKVEVLDVYDGVQPGITPLQPQSTRSADGRLWFVNDNLVQTFDPRNRPKNTLRPNVVVERLAANDVSYPIQHSLKLPALIRNLEIDYTALSFVVPQKVRFRYKLEGRDTSWQEAGVRRQAFYTDLVPGSYRFRVIGCNNDGVWNQDGATIDFAVAPAWYQTGWFRVSCTAALLLLLWAVYQLRILRLRRQFAVALEARVDERTRIARELHDTLLQSFHGLMFRFQAARNMLPRSPENAMRTLDDAISSTRNAITESRDAIHDLRSEPTADADLVQLLEADGQELAAILGADQNLPVFRVIVEGERQKISPSLGDEVHRIAREVMRNAFRHAGAKKIEVEIRYGKNQLRLRVRDDGTGLDPKVLEANRSPGHWGLAGIRERAQQIGGQLTIWSEAGAGTEIELTVPDITYKGASSNSRFKLFRKERVS